MAETHQLGEPAPRLGRFAEIIGPPDCPILKRWTLIPWREYEPENHPVRWKLMVHYFLPGGDDRAFHDHPRPFWTFVVRGYYYDLGLDEQEQPFMRERMRPGKLRFRPAHFRHRTKAGPKGCWTIVLMGPIRRRWGFWRAGKWWYWKDFERTFGFGMRCDNE